MRILLTNDDGIDAPGIAEMLKVIDAKHDVVVVAPSRERSGASHALTMLEPIRVEQRGGRRWSVSGTPVDCVYIGLHRLFPEPPDLVVSGINKGANLGDDVFYSGTVGAAREAALNDIPAIAVSLDTQTWPETASGLHFRTAAQLAGHLIDGLGDVPLSGGSFLNLNVPNRPISEIPSVEICGLGRRHYDPVVDECIDPRGRPYYWIGGEPISAQMREKTDGWWLHKGHAVITPLGLDNTCEAHLSPLDKWASTQTFGLENE